MISCLFRRKIAGEAGDLHNNFRLKNRFFHQFFLYNCWFILGQWGGCRVRFCVIPLSSIFPFTNFGTKKGKGGNHYGCVSRQDGGGRANSNKKEWSFFLYHRVNHKIIFLHSDVLNFFYLLFLQY